MADKNYGHNENKNLVNLDEWVKQYMSSSQVDVKELKEQVANMWSTIYPVGSIYLTVTPTNPGEIWGGTWELWGQGRVPVGYNPGDNDFKTVEQVGGSKNLQSHSHSWSGSMDIRGVRGSNGSWYEPGWPTSGRTTNVNIGFQGYSSSGSCALYTMTMSGTTSSSGTGTAQNLQPYIVCYMWKRKA